MIGSGLTMNRIRTVSMIAVAALCLQSYEALAWDTPYRPGDGKTYMSPTAATMPKGAVSFSDHEVGLVQVGAGLADGLELSVMATIPVMQEFVFPSIKYKFLDTGRVRMAVIGLAGAGAVFTENGGGFLAGAGLMIDAGMDSKGKHILSLGVIPGYMLVFYSKNDNMSYTNSMIVASNLAFTFTVSKMVKIMIEAQYGGLAASDSYTLTQCLTINYGLKLQGDAFEIDFGFSRPVLWYTTSNKISQEDWLKYVPMGIPWVSFTYLWN
jgi:hypothetical protein